MNNYLFKHKTIQDLEIGVLCFTEKEAKDYIIAVKLNPDNFHLSIKPLIFVPHGTVDIPIPKHSN